MKKFQTTEMFDISNTKPNEIIRHKLSSIKPLQANGTQPSTSKKNVAIGEHTNPLTRGILKAVYKPITYGIKS